MWPLCCIFVSGLKEKWGEVEGYSRHEECDPMDHVLCVWVKKGVGETPQTQGLLFNWLRLNRQQLTAAEHSKNTAQAHQGQSPPTFGSTPTLPAHPSTLPSPFTTPSHSTTQMQRTWPWGHVLCLWDVPHPSSHPLPPRHEEHDLGSGVSLTFSLTLYHPDMKNTILGSCSSHLECPSNFPSPSTTQTQRMWCHVLHIWGVPHLSPHPLPLRHEEHNPGVMFFVSGVFPHSPWLRSPCLG